MIYDYIVIGGGIAGYTFAISKKIATSKLNILIIEASNKVLRKLKASGNGRGNYCNSALNPNYYNNSDFIANFTTPNSNQFEIFAYTMSWFHSFLIFPKVIDNNIYPYSLSSENLVNAYLYFQEKTKLPLIQDIIININLMDKYYILKGNNNTYKTKHVVIASGSNSYYKEDYVSPLLSCLKQFSVIVHPFVPKLVGFKLKENVKSLAGIRIQCQVSLLAKTGDGLTNLPSIKHVENGEVIFKKDGISGIVIMNISRTYNPNKDTKYYLTLNLVSSLDLKNKITDNPSFSWTQFINNNFPPALAKYIFKNIPDEYIKRCLLSSNTDLLNLRKRRIDVHMIDYLTNNFKFEILDTYDRLSSQVSGGGVDVTELNNDFSLKKQPNIYVIGESTDIDGPCGGYNISYAVFSALKASGYQCPIDLNINKNNYSK